MDMRTLLIVEVILMLCFLLGVCLVAIGNPEFRFARWMVATYACGFVAAILIALGSAIPMGLSVVVADTMIVIAFILLHRGLGVFTGQRQASDITNFILPATLMFCFIYFTYVDENIEVRIIILSFALCWQAGWSAWLLLRQNPQAPHRAVCLTTAGLLVAFCLANMTRGILAFRYRAPHSFLARNDIQAGYTIIFLCFNCCIAMCFIWMVNSGLRIQLEHESRTDVLTGILNRRSLEEQIEREISRCYRSQSPLSILLFDVDHFKHINDVYGHAGGDQVLRTIVHTVKGSLRVIDTFARFGGEEFVIVLPDAGNYAAKTIAERLRKRISYTVLPKATQHLALTASFGVATLRGPLDTWEKIFARADQALYTAKTQGRNQICSSDEVDLLPPPTEIPHSHLPLREEGPASAL